MNERPLPTLARSEASIGATSSSGMFILAARLAVYSSVITLSSSKRLSTMPNLPLTDPNADRNQMIIEETTMTDPALLMKDQPLSHVARSTPPTFGTW